MPDPGVIRLDTGQFSSFDELTGAAPVFLNMLAEGPPNLAARAVRSRPGIRAWAGGPASFPSTDPVVAMTILGGKLIYVTDNGTGTRKVYAVDGASVIDLSIAATDPNIDGLDPVVLQPWREFAFACGGGRIQQISRGLVSSKLGGAPPNAIDLCVIAQRLVVVDPGEYGIFFWAPPGEAAADEIDQSIDFREAEARPDRLVACDNTARQLYMFGEGSTQLFMPDENETFATLGTLENGCLAGSSVVRRGQSMAWLDDQVQLVLAGGEGIQILSERGMASTLEQLQAPEDVWAFRAKIGNHDLITWSWPTDGRAISIDMVSLAFSEWRRWADGHWQPWAPRSHLWWSKRRVHLVGMPDGTIRELSLDAHTDMADPIKWHIRTGFEEAPGRTYVAEARFPVRRGEATSSASTVEVSWRDDEGPFCSPIEATLGTEGEGDPDIVISPAGDSHRRRQWDLTGSGPDVYRLAPGKATYEEVEF